MFLFFCFVFVFIGLVPLGNLQSFKESKGSFKERVSALYNLDKIVGVLANRLFSVRVSLFPDEAVIGEGGWVFLGDKYVRSVSNRRNGLDSATGKRVNRMVAFAARFRSAVVKAGVLDFHVFVAPDKESVYQEFYPTWARGSGERFMERLIDADTGHNYTDLLAGVLAGKDQTSYPLYYKTDSHWNRAGAWFGYRAMRTVLGKEGWGLDVLGDDMVSFPRVAVTGSGDTARVIRINLPGSDFEPACEIKGIEEKDFHQYSFGSNDLLREGSVVPGKDWRRPTLVRSVKALNKKRVLWLMDSFGANLSTFVFSTFSDTVELHYDSAAPETLTRIFSEFKPEIVLVTVVERRAAGFHGSMNDFAAQSK